MLRVFNFKEIIKKKVAFFNKRQKEKGKGLRWYSARVIMQNQYGI